MRRYLSSRMPYKKGIFKTQALSSCNYEQKKQFQRNGLKAVLRKTHQRQDKRTDGKLEIRVGNQFSMGLPHFFTPYPQRHRQSCVLDHLVKNVYAGNNFGRQRQQLSGVEGSFATQHRKITPLWNKVQTGSLWHLVRD